MNFNVDEMNPAGMAKAVIDSAIRKGQGISASGAPLETVLVECIGPGGVAFVM